MASEGLRRLTLEVGTEVVTVLAVRIDMAVTERQQLTSAEQSVVRALFEGKSNDIIAGERGTSPRTVANQIASIFRKHGVASRAELVAQYFEEATP